jgi:hypothetical protein
MGNHAVDLTSPEFNGVTFTETLIYGYYNGNMIFYEPMITRDFILSQTTVSKSIKVPVKYPKAGYYPTNLNLMYNSTTKEYILTLGSMVKYAG